MHGVSVCTHSRSNPMCRACSRHLAAYQAISLRGQWMKLTGSNPIDLTKNEMTSQLNENTMIIWKWSKISVSPAKGDTTARS